MDREPGFGPLRSFPTWAEMTIVIVLAFGLFIYSSAFYAAAPDTPVVSTADDFRSLMLLELIQGGLVLALLWARGWTPEALGVLNPRWRDLRDGAMLLAAIFAVSWIAFYIARVFRPELEAAAIDIDESGMPAALALAFSVVNAGYEELFVCAYIVVAWRGPDLWTAIALSSLLRLSYHLYQGPLAIAVIFPLGVVSAWYFATQRRLLPLILVHATLDILTIWQESA